MDNNTVIDKRTIEVLNSKDESADEAPLFKTASGVVLEILGVSPLFFVDLENKFAPPPPPLVEKDEDTGYEVRNPSDPEYLHLLSTLSQQKDKAMIDVMVGAGTKVVHVPDKLPKPDSDAWIEHYEFYLGMEIPRSGPGRDLAWKKYVALSSGKDVEELARLISLQSGVTESEVNDAIAGFRGDEER